MEWGCRKGRLRLIGVDANVLARLLTADDAAQHSRAVRFFVDRSEGDPAFVSAVTLAGTVWVMRSRYGLPHGEILEAVCSLLETDDFVVDGREALAAAKEFRNPALLTDFLVAQLGQRAGCLQTATFDKRAAKAIPTMEFLA